MNGFDMAAASGSPAHAAAVQAMLPQLLIALVKREGGSLSIPVEEVDATGGELLSFQVLPDGKTFHFKVSKKS